MRKVDIFYSYKIFFNHLGKVKPFGCIKVNICSTEIDGNEKQKLSNNQETVLYMNPKKADSQLGKWGSKNVPNSQPVYQNIKHMMCKYKEILN